MFDATIEKDGDIQIVSIGGGDDTPVSVIGYPKYFRDDNPVHLMLLRCRAQLFEKEPEP